MDDVETVDYSAEVKAKVPAETRREVEQIARERMQSVSDVVRAAVIAYLEANRPSTARAGGDQ